MLIPGYLDALQRDGELAVATAGVVDLDATVPTCPEWTARELVQHLGRVHRWAAHFVRTGWPAKLTTEEEGRVWGDMPADAELVSWLAAGHAALVTALRDADESLACWTFLPAPSPLAFWARRQAHETAIHRADLQSVLGPPSEVDPSFAADGIDELLVAFFTGHGRGWTDRTRILAVTATDVEAGWLLRVGPDGCEAAAVEPDQSRAERADAWLTGPASTLYYGLWNRVPLAPPAVLRGGDEELLDLWRRRARVRWS